MWASYPYLSLPSVKEQATKKHECEKRFHEQLNTCISLSDTDTNSEHLSIADIANRESIHMWKGQLNSLIYIARQVHVCTPNKLYPFPFNI